MSLPNNYTYKPSAIPAYFEAIQNAEAPERFTIKFLENLEFKSTNDRLIVGVLKDLGFLDSDGVPQQRYFQYLDKTQSGAVLAEAVREAYSDLFAINKTANKLSVEDVKNKLRALYAGSKKDTVIARIASTFVALCDYADFSKSSTKIKDKAKTSTSEDESIPEPNEETAPINKKSISLDSLQYHINIVLPESRDQAVYDAIFKSLNDHLGSQNG